MLGVCMPCMFWIPFKNALVHAPKQHVCIYSRILVFDTQDAICVNSAVLQESFKFKPCTIYKYMYCEVPRSCADMYMVVVFLYDKVYTYIIYMRVQWSWINQTQICNGDAPTLLVRYCTGSDSEDHGIRCTVHPASTTVTQCVCRLSL